MLLRELEIRLNLSSQLAGCIRDCHNRSYAEYSLIDLIHQRILQICQSYEDTEGYKLNPAFQTTTGKAFRPKTVLASQPTMTKLENRMNSKELVRLGYALGNIFLDSFDKAPKAIVIDMVPTAVHCHGTQPLLLFNAHEDEYCLILFHVYDGLIGKLITTTIRPGKTPRAGEILTLSKRIVLQIRTRYYPDTVLIFRADSHHSKLEVHAWYEANEVEFVNGQSPNRTLNRQFEFAIEQVKLKYKRLGKTCRG